MSRSFALGALALPCLVALVGCGSQAPPSSPPKLEMKVQAAKAPPADGGNPVGDAAIPDVAAERKIIFNGVLEVEVKNFGAAHKDVNNLMKLHGAFYSKTEIRGDSGKKRVGTFTIKVPVEHFQTLLDSIAELGDPVRNTTDSQDVTEEYIDVAARVKNLKGEEEALQKILKELGSKLDDVFKLRDQILKIREQIERAEGRLQALGKLTSLSTITLTLRDRKEYVAPTAAKVTERESFEARATGTFASSVGLLRNLGEHAGLFLLALAPWLPLVLPAALLARRYARKWTVKPQAA
jgi:Domain of unknown function (DUF4349)